MELIQKLTLSVENWQIANPGKPDPNWISEKIQIIDYIQSLQDEIASLKLFETWQIVENTISRMCNRDPELTLVSIQIPLVSPDKINFGKAGLIPYAHLLKS